MTDLLILASEGAEGIPASHIASKLAVPIGILFFCGAVYLLLWSNYGAKKGALIYSTALFGFCMFIGVFWWFGAPGTPVATGLQNFPGQAPDAYVGKWYAFEPGSPRADFFSSTNDLSGFVSIEEFVGSDDPEDPALSFARGDLEQGSQVMVTQLFPTDESGGLRVGANRRSGWAGNSPTPESNEVRADPFYSPRIIEELITDDAGTSVGAIRYEIVATYLNESDSTVSREVVVEEGTWFAFKDPGALWFPSAVWTFAALILFALSLFGLDRMEQREKRQRLEVEEAEDLAVPIAQ
jgi:hypothetical protein